MSWLQLPMANLAQAHQRARLPNADSLGTNHGLHSWEALARILAQVDHREDQTMPDSPHQNYHRFGTDHIRSIRVAKDVHGLARFLLKPFPQQITEQRDPKRLIQVPFSFLSHPIRGHFSYYYHLNKK